MTGKKPDMLKIMDGKLLRSSDHGNISFKILRLLFQKKQFKCIKAFKKNQHLNVNDRKLIVINYFLQQLGMEQQKSI